MKRALIFLGGLTLGSTGASLYLAWALELTEIKVYPWSFFLWDQVVGEHYPSEFLLGWAIVFSGALAGIGAVVALRLKTEGQVKESQTFGSARFATEKELETSGLLSRRGVVLGLDLEGRYLRDDGPEHITVIAPTRSGKGVGLIIPTLLSWPDSVVVVDPKGENFQRTSGFREEFSKVYYFNPCDPHSHRFNPMLEIRQGNYEVRDSQLISDMLVDPGGEGFTSHWQKTAQSLLVASMLYVLRRGKTKSLFGVEEFLADPGAGIPEKLEEMRKVVEEDGSAIAREARRVLDKSVDELSGVVSTLHTHLKLFDDPLVAAATSESDFSITDLVAEDKPMSLYLAIPTSDINRLRPIFRLMLDQILRRLTEELPTGKRRRVLFVIDEFPTLGRLEFFESALSYLAGYGIKVLLASTSLNHLARAYGERNAILDNCHVQVFHTPNTQETAEYISRALGQRTEVREQKSFSGRRFSWFLGHTMVSQQESARALLTPDEVKKFPKDEQILFLSGMNPIKSKKIRYFETIDFLAREKRRAKLRNETQPSQEEGEELVVAVGGEKKKFVV